MLVVAPRHDRAAAVRDLLTAGGFDVLGTTATLADVESGIAPEADVAIVVDPGVDSLARHVRPLVVIADDPATMARELASRGGGPWGVVWPDAGADELHAAVRAVAAGYAVMPPALAAPAIAATADGDSDSEPPAVESLTARERDVLQLLAEGMPNRGIAAALGISEHTVKFHLASIFGKLGASTRTEAVRRGLRRGLIQI